MLGIPGLANSLMTKKTIRAPVNPLDKSTIVSIYPKEINERNHTIQPGVFQIPPGSYDRPSILVVSSSSWWREIDEDQPLLEIPVSSIQVADSVVRDYCIGLLGCNMADIMPGIFYIPGEWTVERIKKEHQPLLQKYTCLTCHNPNTKLIGPSYQEIATKKYSADKIVQLIQKPNPANWPGYATKMPPMAHVPKADLTLIAQWIKSLEKTK